jgi:vitamin B12 transporter
MHKKRILLCLLLPSLAWAQTPDSTRTLPLGEVIIQENRLELPFSQQNRNIQVLDQSMIKSLPVRSVNELLSYVSGVDVRQRGPQGVQTDISIDGGTFDQTLVLLNGIKVSDPQTGHNMMNLPINPDAIERIEILRGSAARIYGINALTGAINIVTKKARATGLEAHLFSGSSFEEDDSNGRTFASYGIRATGTLNTENSGHLLALSREEGSGYRYNTAFINNKAFYQGSFLTSTQNEWQLMAGFIDNDFGANGYYAAPGDKESQEIVQTGLASLSYSAKLNSNWTIKPRLSYRYNEDDYRYIRTDLTRFRNEHTTHVATAEVNNIFDTRVGVVGLGLEGRSEKINSSNLGKRERNNFGISGEYKFDGIENLLLNLGTYLNYNSDFGWQLFPGLDAGFSINPNWKVFTNIGTGQRLPTYTDLYYRGPTNIGNDQLKTEDAFFTEAGVRFNNTRSSMTASYFVRKVDGFIDWVKGTVTDPWQPQNFRSLTTRGLTLTADHRILDGSASGPGLHARISFTYLDPKRETDASMISRYALESLRNQLTGSLHMTLIKSLSFTLGAKYAQRINYKDYTTVDARLAFDRGRYHLYLDSSNINDAQYIEAGSVPMPGRWNTAGARIDIFK